MPSTLPTAFWQLNVWTNDTKSVLVTTSPITRMQRVYRHMALFAPYSYEISCFASDARTQNITKGQYFELTASKSTQRIMWARGYVQTATKGSTGGGSTQDVLQITGASPSIALNTYRVLGALSMGPGTNFNSVLDAYNGVNPVNGSYPPDHKGILTGSGWTAQWKDGIGSTSPPGSGDIWRGDWNIAYSDVIGLAQHYNFYTREKPSATDHVGTNLGGSGVLEVGPLNDASGLTVWGGNPLLVDMQTNHGFPMSAVYPDVGKAQQLGYAVVSGASWQDNSSSISNLVWALGKGKPEEGGCTLKSFAGGIPSDDLGNAINGWTKWQPNAAHGGRVYFYKAGTKTTYNGNAFYIVAAQQQDAQWAYGVMDLTSAQNYGIREYVLVERKITDPTLLLSAALGHIEYNSDPTPSFELVITHPLVSGTGVPTVPAPGQSVQVNYSGQVHQAIEIDTNAASPTYGQWIPNGSYTYLDYPGTADSVKITKLKRCVSVEDTWEAGTYQQKLTMGQGKWKWKHWADDMARRMEKTTHHRPVANRWGKVELSGITFLQSSSPAAWEDEVFHQLNLNPGASAVSDVDHPRFFGPHHYVQFSANVTEASQYLDFWFAKPWDNGTLTSPNPGDGRCYGVLRLAFTNSATSSGFYTTQDGAIYVQRGHIPRTPILDANSCLVPGEYRVKVSWTGGGYRCHIWSFDGDPIDPTGTDECIATWNDKPSPTLTAPSTAPTAAVLLGGFKTPGAHKWAYSYVDTNGQESQLSPASSLLTTTASNAQGLISGISQGPGGTAQRKLYVTKANQAAPWYYLVTINNNTATSWHDAASDGPLAQVGPAVIGNWGAIGWKLHQGSQFCSIFDLHALAHQPAGTARPSVPSSPQRHHWHNLWHAITAYDSAAHRATVAVKVGIGGGALVDDKGDILRNEDNSDIQWNIGGSVVTIVANVQVLTENYLIYNGSNYTVTSGGFPVPSQSFGTVPKVKTHKASWEHVYILGKLSKDIDNHTHFPYWEGHHHGPTQSSGRQVAAQSVGTRHANPTQTHKKHRRKLVPGTGGHYIAIHS